MIRHPAGWVVLQLVLAGLAAGAYAKPTGPDFFCQTYPDSASCAGRSVTCTQCHTSTSPVNPGWNDYGQAVLDALFDSHGGSFNQAAVSASLQDVESQDSDGDGISNLEEILLGTLPGDIHSFLAQPVPGSGAPNPVYNVGNHDAPFAFRRVSQAFCGVAPTYARMQQFEAAADQTQQLHALLDECLSSTYWLEDALPRMADERVRPIDLGTSFQWDYRLWRYVMSGDRDIRDLLLAQYYVREPVKGQLMQVADVDPALHDSCTTASPCAFDEECVCAVGTSTGNSCEDPPGTQVGTPQCRLRSGGQALAANQRAGMISTAWFHFINTMFSAMPRTTAAHAMRSYLGMDIARQQGIRPVVGEPLDVDNKGVTQQECAQCHATLDPATYVFAVHRGIEGGGAPSAYDPTRPTRLGLWAPGAAPQGKLLGQDVSTLTEWAAVAAASDQFAYTITRAVFEAAVGRPPNAADDAEFTALWRGLGPVDNHSVNRLCHRLVDTRAFGAP